MSAATETLADIVAEMGRRENSRYYPKVARNIMRQYRTRIEAAWKRQEQCYLDQIRDAVNQWGHEKYKAEHAPVGNSAAMREALVRTDLFLSALGKWLKVNDEGQEYALAAGAIHTLVEHALAAPPRNCDAGTPEEQTARYDKFCNTNITVEKCCTDCPALGVADCKLAWAQMPYKKGATK